MARPTLIDTMSEREKQLAANMLFRNESWETIFKYISLEDTGSARTSIEQLRNELTNPLSEALYTAYLNLAEVDTILAVTAEKAQAGSDRHITPYRQLTETKIKLVKEIDDLWEREQERGNTWEPSFDLDSPEFKVFKAAVSLFLTIKDDENQDFDELSPSDQTRFLQILSEGS